MFQYKRYEDKLRVTHDLSAFLCVWMSMAKYFDTKGAQICKFCKIGLSCANFSTVYYSEKDS